MWKAEVFEITKNSDGSAEVSVKYTEGGKVHNHTHHIISGGMNSLKKIVKEQILALQAQFAPANDIPLGEIDLTPEPVVVDDKLSKKRDFEILTNNIYESSRLIGLGILTEQEVDLNKLKTDAKNLWNDINKK